jgi:pimeloyl-ACP methyl ester carboxylesterase
MSEPQESTVEVQGRPVRLLSAGEGDRTLLMLHTGVPGLSPIAGSADLLVDLLDQLRRPGWRLLAPDLPGAGRSELSGLDALTPQGQADWAADLIDAAGADGELHLLAHGDSSLAALRMAREGVAGRTVASCCLIAPNSPAPTGDSVQNVALLHPPSPKWSDRSQRWAVRRLTYFPDRFPAWLMDVLVANAARPAHLQAVDALSDPSAVGSVIQAQIAEQDALYAYCRDVRYQIPISIVWGSSDVTSTVPRGAVLADLLSGGPAPLDFQLVNQCGHFAQFDRSFQVAALAGAAMERAANAAAV